MTRRLSLTSGLLALGLSASLLAFARPQDQNAPVFRSRVDVVYVDAYPRRDGRLIEGLGPEDFQVLEDGKPQKVEAFEFIRTQPNASTAVRRDPNTKEDGDRLAADPHNRVFVVYLDIYHTTVLGGHDATAPLLEFLNRSLSANDLFGIVTPEAPVPVRELVLARETTTLQDELTRHYDWGLADRPVIPRTPYEEELFSKCEDGDSLIALSREVATITSLRDLMMHLRDLRDERKNVVFVTGGFRAGPSSGAGRSRSGGSGGGHAPSLPPIGVGPGGRLGLGAPQMGGDNSAWCRQEQGRLRGSIPPDSHRDLLTLANQANVSFYPIDLGGLSIYQGATAAPGLRLQELAENTGGIAIVRTNDIRGGFQRIADDLSAYYLLGYTSSNSAFDGKYRQIEVKIAQPHVSVTARRGYLAANLNPHALVAAPVGPAAEITDELGRLSRLRADAELFGYGVRTASGLDIVVELADQAMNHPAWQNGADVQAMLARPSGDPLAVTGRLEPMARGTLLRLPLSAGDAGPWHLILRATSSGDAIEGLVDIATPSAGALLGAPVSFRGTASARIPLRPVADFQFRRAERLHVEWPVLKTLDRRVARVLDRRGQPLALEATVTEISGDRRADGAATPATSSRPLMPASTVVAVDLNMAPLAEGDYLLELSAGAGSENERKLLAFRVIR